MGTRLLKSLFGRTEVMFYPRFAECEEDRKSSSSVGNGIIAFCDEYRAEIECVYGDILNDFNRIFNNLDVLVAGPSLGADGYLTRVDPRAYPSGRTRHVVIMFVRQLTAIAGAVIGKHPGVDKGDVISTTLGMIFLQHIHIASESDLRVICSRTEDLGEMMDTPIGEWLVGVLMDNEYL